MKTILTCMLSVIAVLGCCAQDDTFKYCHDFTYDDDITIQMPDGFSLFDYKANGYDGALFTNSDSEYPHLFGHAGWIYPVMAESDSKDCMLLFPASGFDMSGVKMPAEELRALVEDTNLDTTDMIKTVAQDDMSMYSNADTAYIYEFKFLKPYLDRFTHCVGIRLRKYAHPDLMLKIALTDEGLEKRDKYVRTMLDAFRYGDALPERGIEEEIRMAELRNNPPAHHGPCQHRQQEIQRYRQDKQSAYSVEERGVD